MIDALGVLPRPPVDGVRWTTLDRWHVTLRFFGEVDTADAIVDALRTAPLTKATATVGPSAALLGRGVVHLPVEGLTELAATVVAATTTFGAAPPARPFRGHLTLARTKGRRVDLAPLGLGCEWPVGEIELMRSHLGRGGARYETLAVFALRSP